MTKKKEEKKLRYDLACGDNKTEGCIGVDIVQNKNKTVDILWDLNKYPWKWAKNDSVDEIYISHFIEHLPQTLPDGTNGFFRFFDECYRILKVGGTIALVAPYYSSIRATQDPTHTRAISEASFLYFNKGWREMNNLEHYDIKSDFDYGFQHSWYPEWQNRSMEAKDFALKHYINVVSDVHITMTKREPVKKK